MRRRLTTLLTTTVVLVLLAASSPWERDKRLAEFRLAGTVNEVQVYPRVGDVDTGPKRQRVVILLGVIGGEREVTCEARDPTLLARCAELVPGSRVLLSGGILAVNGHYVEKIEVRDGSGEQSGGRGHVDQRE
jgi:hypothetical protein